MIPQTNALTFTPPKKILEIMTWVPQTTDLLPFELIWNKLDGKVFKELPKS